MNDRMTARLLLYHNYSRTCLSVDVCLQVKHQKEEKRQRGSQGTTEDVKGEEEEIIKGATTTLMMIEPEFESIRNRIISILVEEKREKERECGTTHLIDCHCFLHDI